MWRTVSYKQQAPVTQLVIIVIMAMLDTEAVIEGWFLLRIFYISGIIHARAVFPLLQQRLVVFTDV